MRKTEVKGHARQGGAKVKTLKIQRISENKKPRL